MPVSGSEFSRYGGNTTSFAIVADGDAVAFIDAGTGFSACRSFGIETAPEVAVVLTHYHWDHIQGLSMSDDIWKGTRDMTLWGPGDPAEVLTRAISPPLFPVSIADAEAVTFATVDGPIELPDLTIEAFPVHHPQGALGYMVRGPHGSVAIVTDHEAGSDIDEGIREAITGVDVLVHDAQYLPEEANTHVGWGHSTFEDAVEMAEAVGARHLMLTSHDPTRTDTAMDAIVEQARARFTETVAAVPGLEIAL